jgi:hypothetical protein
VNDYCIYFNTTKFLSIASSHSDHGSKHNSNRKRSHRSNEEPSLPNNTDKTMSHIMANGVR